MFFLPLLIIIGALLGLALGGSTSGWARARIRWWQLALGSLAVQLALHNPPVDQQPWALQWGPVVWLLALAAMLLVLLRNALTQDAQRYAWRLATLGIALNLLVAAANGGYMPQSADARAVAGRAALAPQVLHNVAQAGPDTRLAWLGDVIPEPAGLPAANSKKPAVRPGSGSCATRKIGHW
jgi:hypothetical protein